MIITIPLFICVWMMKGEYYIDVFDPDGKYIAKISLKSRPYVIKKSKLYTIEEDEEGYQLVKRYRISWKI